MGHLRMPCTTARAKNGVKVSLLPVACSNLPFIFSRSLTMRVTSTSKTPCTCALVRFDSTMCSAIFLRMTDMGTTSPGVTAPTACNGPVTAGAAGADAAAAGARGWRRRSGGPSCTVLGDERLDVFLGDAAAKAGSRDLGQVDIVLFRDLAHQRTGANLALLACFGSLLGRGSGLRLFYFSGRRRCLGLRRAATVSAGRSSGLRGRGSGWRWGRWRGGLAFSSDRADHGIDLHGGSGLDLDVLQRAGGRRGNFSINLVGGDFEQRLVALDFLARLLQPLGNGSFKDRLPHLGHDYISWHIVLPRDI